MIMEILAGILGVLLGWFRPDKQFEILNKRIIGAIATVILIVLVHMIFGTWGLIIFGIGFIVAYLYADRKK